MIIVDLSPFARLGCASLMHQVKANRRTSYSGWSKYFKIYRAKYTIQ